MLRSLLAVAALLFAAAAFAQDEPVQAVQPPAVVAPDALGQAQAAAQRGDAAEALSRYLRVLSSRPDDPAALAGAGRAALDVGDVNAAAGFFARADARDPRNAQVKAGLARVLLQRGDARGALRYFREATGLGLPAAAIASDRGLAYDLRGDARRAQADYEVALAAGESAETVRRLALSQAIAGDRAAAMATLDPLLRKQDVPAWRTRALVFALTGDPADALTGAALVMRRDQVDALAPYLPRLAALKPADKAAAVHLGRFPSDATLTQTAATIPSASSAATSPVVTASAVPAEETKARERALASVLAGARKRAGSDAAIRSRADRIALADAAETRAATQAPVAPVSAPPLATAATLDLVVPVPAPAVPTPIVTAAAPPPEDRSLSSWTLAAAQPARDVTAAPAPAPAPSDPAPEAVPTPSPPVEPTPAPAAASQPVVRPPSPGAKPAPSRAEKLAEDKARRADAAAKKAAEDKRVAEAEERKAKARDPARHWVQVAGGANKADLGKAWDGLKKKWPKQLAGRAPWTMHYRFTNRLLIGPFPSSDAAQDWVGERKKEGLASFRVETNAGDPVERVKS